MATDDSGVFGSSEEEQRSKAAFVATFAMLAKLAAADGETSRDEIKLIDGFMRDTLSLSTEKRQFAIAEFNKARKSDKEFSEYARDYKELLSDNEKMLDWMMSVLLDVSAADEEYSAEEQKHLEEAKEIFGISEKRFKKLHDERGVRLDSLEKNSPIGEESGEETTNEEATNEEEKDASPKMPQPAEGRESSMGDERAYKRLRLSADAENDELVAAYKARCAEYSPSRIVELDLPQEFVDLAEELFGEIQAAYRKLRQSRGI